MSRVDLSWGAATDDVGVAHYDLHRGTRPGFTPGTANRIAQPQGTSFSDTGLPAGTFYYKVIAVDVGGNQGPASNESAATVTVDDTPPEVSLTAPQAGTVSGIQTIIATATAGQGVAGVQFGLDGRNLGAEDTAAPFTTAWDTRAELNGAHTLRAVARDTASATATSAPIAVNVSNAGVSTAGLQAAYSFDDQIGTAFVDASGNFRTATLTGGDWTSAGRYGGAVSLSGSNAEVDPPALGTFYKTGFTLEAWVYKQTSKVDVGVVGSWNGGGPMIWVDHVTGHYRLTLGGSFGNYLDSGRSPAVGRWQHVAATYDGSVARFYVDGVLGSELDLHRRRRQLEHLADRRLRRARGRLLRRPDRRRPDLQPRAHRRRGPDGHGIPHPTGSHAADRQRLHARERRHRRQRREPGHREVQPADAGCKSRREHVHLEGPSGNAVPSTVSYDASTSAATLQPERRAPVRNGYRARAARQRRQGSRRQRPRCRRGDGPSPPRPPHPRCWSPPRAPTPSAAT